MKIMRDANGRVLSVGGGARLTEVAAMGSGFLLVEDGQVVAAFDSLERAMAEMRQRTERKEA